MGPRQVTVQKSCAYDVRKAPIRDLVISIHNTGGFERQTTLTKRCQGNRCVGRFPWSGPLTVDFPSKSLRLQAFLKDLGTKRAYSTAKRFARLNYAGRLVSLSACARWKSLRRLLNELPQVWIFAISYPIFTWSMQARETERRNSREPWVYGCAFFFFFFFLKHWQGCQ